MSKKAYCCARYGKGCVPGMKIKYDCAAGFSNWVRGWSLAKKDWCCKLQGKGCTGF